MNRDHANSIAVTKILSHLPVQPKRINAHKILYLSPLHAKKAILFEVDTQTNRWYDHGHGLGGTPVDLVCAYLKSTHEAHTEADAFRWLNNMVISPDKKMPANADLSAETQPQLTLRLKAKRPIQDPSLIHYLEKQGIQLVIAQRFLKEIRLCQTQTKKHFLALGFPNEEGGLELCNPFFNDCLGPQSVSFIRGQTPKPTAIHLFKNVLDYLSVISRLNGQSLKGDTIVLNTLCCLQQAIPYMRSYGYSIAYSWLDNDEAGQNATFVLAEFCQTETALKHKPMNKLYAPHQDVNAWHRHTLNLTR